jgi:hypothetical protein
MDIAAGTVALQLASVRLHAVSPPLRPLRQELALFPPQSRQLAGWIEEGELADIGPGAAAPRTPSCRTNSQAHSANA